MGAVFSYYEPFEPEQTEMRLASREVCDDETWANTVLNRSACSVQQRLHMLLSESENDVRPTRSRTPSIEFAQVDMVRIFQVEQDDHSDRSDSDNEQAYIPKLCADASPSDSHSLLFDTDLW
ncbi:hypothetical protein BWQ96_05388 [Gracilariopsis chorda]|uniref:Uncharacterized protein n=1 Tax=Gracilariopsis chorda TaxID=448386 RepID=A0A2V3IS03_9FLOR|nr:hypothetical protein BWQ96_05388 [Gracilariopsis chorda]|eukprot:PXF44898.1 hypothetical protein BWQ96_05388 [Gracilariopsis chorda]